MNKSSSESQAEFLERMRKQFDFGPYPRHPIDKAPREDSNELFIHNLATPYYLQHQKTVDTSDKVILDAGCGTGYKALTLAHANPGAKIVGIDLSPHSIDLARQRFAYHDRENNVEFHVLAIEDLPQLGMEFDYINCDEVLYFFDDISRGLAVLRSVLKPTGIIRANLHSLLQRGLYFNAQELFDLMGLMEDDSADLAMPIVIETMKAIKPNTILKQQTWKSFYEDENNENAKEQILANYLLRGDRGYRIKDLFQALQQADLAFLSMVDWRGWNIVDLFQEPGNLPDYLAMGLADSPPEIQLTMYELLHPVHRLLDFWCTHPSSGYSPLPVAEWTLDNWLNSQVTLHPQLRTEVFQKAALEALQQNGPFVISSFLSLPTINPISISYDVAVMLLQLWDGPKPFAVLADFWQRTHPMNLITLEPTTPAAAAQQVADALGKLEVFLYVLPEPIL